MRADPLMDAIGLIDDRTVQSARRYRRRRWSRGWCAALAAAVLCMLLTVPTLAFAVTDPVYEALYLISPAAAQALRPVRMSCEDNGIRMEVISASIHGDNANIYISMQDLTGDRIDGTMDLYDSYRINRPFDGSATCQLVSYDAEQKAATFLICITRWGGQDIEGGKITFSVREILSGKQTFEDLLPQLDLGLVARSPFSQSGVDIRGWSQPGGDRIDVESIPVLTQQDDLLFSPLLGVQITAMGYLDGKLHIQAHYDNIHETDNHGYLYLQNADGERIRSDLSISFWDEEHSGSYEEYVFDIPADKLPGYQAYGYFRTGGVLTKGRWQVTFPLEEE